MRVLVIYLVVLAGKALGQQSAYGQCGGIGYVPQSCTAGYTCSSVNPYYSQCTPQPIPAGQQSPYGQCAGQNYNGMTQCSAGYYCKFQSQYYSQCVPGSAPAGSPAMSTSTSTTSTTSTSTSTSSTSAAPTSTSSTTTTSTSTSSTKTTSTSTSSTTTSPTSTSSTTTEIDSSASPQALYAQCGGQNWTGGTTCTQGASCVYSNPYYSQCLPSSDSSSATGSTSSDSSPTPTPTSTSSTPSTMATSTRSTSSTSSSSTSPPSSGKVALAGVNIAGFDFGCGTDGTCNIGNAYPPLGPSYYEPDGPWQMTHFRADGFNVFRLPVGWQYLINNANTPSGNLDSTNAGKYDMLVQACLSGGTTYCIIDIHNYARFNGGIIGQGGPSNDVFASLWSSLAKKYASQSKVIFGLMNEPHDLNSITTWATSVQAAVTAIRAAGATTQMILLPGTNYASAQYFVSSGSADALSAVKNPDGSTTNLLFDVHKYLDSDGSGSNSNCVGNYINEAFQPLATYLRSNGRVAFLTETGGGNTQSCVTYLCQTIAFLDSNSDVFAGYVGWAAGSFDTNYVLSETPNSDGTDQLLLASCMKP